MGSWPLSVYHLQRLTRALANVCMTSLRNGCWLLSIWCLFKSQSIEMLWTLWMLIHSARYIVIGWPMCNMMCIYVCVCVSARVCTCVYACTCSCMCVYMCAYMFVYNACMYVHWGSERRIGYICILHSQCSLISTYSRDAVINEEWLLSMYT